jgi:hypothetical protein
MRRTGLKPIAAAILAAPFAALPAAADLPSDYPNSGKAIDVIDIDDNYSNVLAERPRSVSIMRARAHGFVPSSEMHAYAQSILDRLLDGIPLPDTFDPQVRVLAAPDYGAVCTPDGTLVVSLGLLEQSDTEDEIAFILGHEVSHAILRHHDSDWFTRTQYYAVVNARSLSDVTSSVGVVGGGLGGTLGDIQRGINIASAVYELSESVLAPRFQQGQEDEADALGLDLMIRAGYNPDGAQRALERLAAAEDAAARAAEEAREAQQEEERGSRGGGGLFSGGGGGGLLGGALGSVNIGGIGIDLGTVADMALSAATEQLAEESVPHRPATERADFLVEYQFREYRDLIPGDVVLPPWAPDGPTETLENWTVATTITNYRSANAVLDHLQGIETADADTSASYAVQMPTDNHAYTQFALARLRDSESRGAEAEAARQAAVSAPEPSWIAYNAEIDARLMSGDLAGADMVMADAVVRFEESPVLLPKRITIQSRLGNDGEVRELLSQCGDYDIRELQEQCEAAAN